MELTGKIHAVLPVQEGEGKNGTWKKQDYVIEYYTPNSQYSKKMSFNLWGERIDQFNIQEGQEVTVSFDIDCREWNGRWFNDIRAWRVVPAQQQGQPIQQQAMPEGMPTPPPFSRNDAPAEDASSDLPF